MADPDDQHDSESPPMRPDRSGAGVVRDVNCLGCGYSLRGLSADGRCPECSQSVRSSLHANVLRYADPDWLHRLHIGLRLACFGSLAVLLTFIAALLLAIVILAGIADDQARRSGIGYANINVFMCIVYAAMALMFVYPIGWWVATSSDPAEPPERVWRQFRLRTFGVLFIPAIFVWLSPWLRSGGWAPTPLETELLSYACFAVAWAHIYLMVRWLRQLRFRCRVMEAQGSRRLRRHLDRAARWSFWLPPALLIIHWSVGVFDLWMTGGRPAAPGIVGFGSGVGPVLPFLFWIWILNLSRTALRAVRLERAEAMTLFRR